MKSPLSMRHSKNVRHSVWCAVILLFTTSSAPLLARRCAEQIPRELWVLPFDSQDPAKMVLAESLQGLTGAHLPKLWIDKRGGMSAVILQQLQDEGTEIHMVNSVWDLPDDFWSSVDGAIVYNLGTHSLNTAVSLCGIKNAVAVDESILDQAEAQGLEIVYDARGQSEDQIFDQYLHSFSRGIAVEQADTKPAYLRDFAILHHAFTFYGFDSTFRRRVASALGPGATIFGWGPSEFTWISDFSRSAGQGVASDWCVNLSAMSRLPVEIPDITPASPDPAEEGQRIVAFVLSDGDNVQWLTGGMPLDSKYFGSERRGEFKMNWEVSPLLAKLAPRVFKYFFDNATDMDGFVAAGSPGYRYIYFEPDDPKGTTDAAQTAPYLDASQLSIVSVINDNHGTLDDVVPLLQLPEVDGVIYKPYSPYNGLRGAMSCSADPLGRDKFAVSYKFLLWEGASHPNDTPQAVADAVSEMPSSPLTDPGSYALVNVHAWSWNGIGGPIEAVKQTINLLPPNTRVVTISEFFALLNANFSCSPALAGSVASRRHDRMGRLTTKAVSLLSWRSWLSEFLNEFW
jgi:hypothetical protein